MSAERHKVHEEGNVLSVRQYTPGARELWGRVRKYCEKEIAFEAKSKWRWGRCLRGKQYLLRAPEHEKGVPEERAGGWADGSMNQKVKLQI